MTAFVKHFVPLIYFVCAQPCCLAATFSLWNENRGKLAKKIPPRAWICSTPSLRLPSVLLNSELSARETFCISFEQGRSGVREQHQAILGYCNALRFTEGGGNCRQEETVHWGEVGSTAERRVRKGKMGLWLNKRVLQWG